MAQSRDTAQDRKPDSTGPNARPREETISQTGPGLPDDAGEPVDITPEEEKRIERSIREA